MTYQPTAVDIEYALEMMRTISNGGTLAFPKARLKYLVDHQQKKLTLQNPQQLQQDADSRQTHECTKVVWAVIGYTVEEHKSEALHLLERHQATAGIVGTVGAGTVVQGSENPRAIYRGVCIECGKAFDIAGAEAVNFPECPHCGSGQSVQRKK